MGMHAAGRRRQIRAKGRPAILRRRTAPSGPATAVTCQAVPIAYRPEQLAGGIQQGDELVLIMADEIVAAGWPGPPRKSDEMVIDGLVWAVQGVESRYEGVELLGYDIWVRGGR